MLRATLLPHPSTPCPAVHAIEASLEPGARLLFVLRGDIAALQLPPPAAPVHTDELWRHFCCELFVADATGAAYGEYNFSASGAWAAYRFDACRSGMRVWPQAVAPVISLRTTPDELVLEAKIAPGHLAPNARIALCTVVEERGGRLSYWALAHPAPQPDFHHRDAFLLEWPHA